MDLFRRRTSAILALLLALAASGSVARAQLPREIYNTPRPLTAEQSAVLKSHVQRSLEGMKSPDGKVLADARRSLLEPFRQDTSRTFRLAYNEALTPGLAAIARDEAAEMANRQAAIWILGSIASDEADAALRDVMGSEEPALRYAAATGLERSMRSIPQDRNAYSNALQSEKNVARYLREALGDESDPEVLRAMFAAAAALPTVADAIDAVSEGLTLQARRLKDDASAAALNSLRTGLERLQKRYVVDTVGGPAIAPHEHNMIEAAASILLLAVEHGRNDLIIDQNRQVYTDLTRTSENLMSLLCRQATAQTKVTSAISAGQIDEAAQALETGWLAEDGPIYSNRTWEFQPGAIEDAFRR